MPNAQGLTPRWLVCLLLSVVVPCVGHAQASPENITRSEAVRRALAGNLELRDQGVRVRQARARIVASQGKFDLRLTTEFGFQQQRIPPVTGTSLDAGRRDDYYARLGLNRELETGGSLELSLQSSLVDSTLPYECGDDAGEGCQFGSAQWRLVATQPLWRGLGIEVARADIQRRTIERDQALLTRRARACAVLRDVLTTYWELSYATETAAIRRSALALAKQQLAQADALIAEGRRARSERIVLEHAIVREREQLLRTEQELLVRSNALTRIWGAPIAPAGYRAMDDLDATPFTVSVEMALRRAVAGNPQLASLRSGVRLRDVELATARSLLWPRLDAVAAVGSSGRQPTFQQAVGQTARLEQSNWSVGVLFELPLQNRSARGQLRATQAQRELALLDAQRFEQELRTSVIEQVSAARGAHARVELLTRAVKLAQENLDMEQARFARGYSTSNDVLLRQHELRESRLSLVRARVDGLAARVALNALTGDLLEQLGLTLNRTAQP